MAPLTKAMAAPLARSWTRHTLPVSGSIRATPSSLISKPFTAVQQQRSRADDASQQASSYDSPFHRSGGTARETTSIPSFKKYKSDRGEVSNRVFQYFMVGTFGALTAMGAKATVQGML